MRTQIALVMMSLACNVAVAQTTKMPTIETVTTGVVWRVSNRGNDTGLRANRWQEVRIANIFGFKRRPLTGRNVTVVPLDVDIPPHVLTIESSRRSTNCAGTLDSGSWDIELQRITQEPYFEIAALSDRREEYPFDVAIIYPAVKSARQLRRHELKKSMFPPGISLNTITAAIDVTGEGQPDLLIVKHCCGNPTKSDGCDLTCGKTFRKVRSKWQLVDSSAPC